MKTTKILLSLLSAIALSMIGMLPNQGMAQVDTAWTEIFNFASLPSSDNDDTGSGPIIVSNGVIYGEIYVGNPNGNFEPDWSGTGTIYRMNTDGTDYTNLYNFSSDESVANSDGAVPVGLVLSGNVLYGMAEMGGPSGGGTIFRINTDGTGFNVIHSFSPPGLNYDGWGPQDPLILCSNTLYGTARNGGVYGYGTIFKVDTDGSNFVTLHSFTDSAGPTPPPDGAFPYSSLMLFSNVLYGTTWEGGSGSGYGYGIIFSVNTDGTDYSNLYNFSSDGLYPYSGLTVIDNVLYGQTSEGGTYGNGTIFKINPDGTGFTTIFDATNGLSSLWPLNSFGDLLCAVDGNGYPFIVNTNGTGYVSYPVSSIANEPNQYGAGVSSLCISGNTLYGPGGAADGGQDVGFAVILKLGPYTPFIDDIVYNTNNSVTLFCSGTPYFTYLMQSTPSITPSVTWQTISTNQADLNGNWQYTDYRPTNIIYGTFTNYIYSGNGDDNPNDPDATNSSIIGTNVWSGYVQQYPAIFYRAAGPP